MSAAPVRREGGMPSQVGQSPFVAPEVTTDASARASGIIAPTPMRSGAGSTNIDPPPPRARLFSGDIAIKERRGRWSLEPELVPPPPIRSGPTPAVLWIGALSFVLLSAIVFGPTGLTLLDKARKQDGGVAVAPPPEGSSRVTTARLSVERKKGFKNEPLPLGVSLSDASGRETLTLDGLVAGTRLTVGAPLGLTHWLVSARDLENALAYAPKDFVGVMDVTIILRSVIDEVMDNQVVRLEWVQKKEDPSTRQLDPARLPPIIPPLDPTEVSTLIKLGEDLLKNGDVASARPLLKRAANTGNARAALELGMTFDPVFLAKAGVLGLVPDVAQAREWYDRAFQLGSTEAARHLERLASSGK
jgi:hypothetical protein